MANEKITRYLSNWTDEQSSAAIYTALAGAEKDPRLAEIYRRMTAVELRHAEKWAGLIKEAGGTVPVFKPELRTRMIIWAAKRFGPAAVLPGIQAMEQDGSSGYAGQPEAGKEMVADEQSHARMLKQLQGGVPGGMEGSALAQMEGRHRTGGNALRAAVLGANDGMVSNLSLVMGVAGAALDSRTILITGLAGLLAGAISMALGEWLSVQSSRELFAHQIKIEREEVESNPEEEREELSLIYQSRGLSPEQAGQLADQILQNKESAVETLAREELGVDPEELGGSAWEAAITSFVLFAIGAIVPVIAFTFLNGLTAVLVSIGFSIVGLFVLGAVTSIFTGRKLLYSGMRMVIFGLLAAAVTYGIGRLIGVSVAG